MACLNKGNDYCCITLSIYIQYTKVNLSYANLYKNILRQIRLEQYLNLYIFVLNLENLFKCIRRRIQRHLYLICNYKYCEEI